METYFLNTLFLLRWTNFGYGCSIACVLRFS